MNRFSRGLCVLAAVLFAAAAIPAQTTVAYVLERRGTWTLGNSASGLTPGQKLPAGGFIRRRSTSPDDYITIVDLQRKVIGSQSCSSNCSGSIALPRASRTSGARSWFQAVMAVIFASPYKDDSNLIRSGGLPEGVVKYGDGNVDLSSMIEPEGTQYLRWRTIKKPAAGEWSKPVKLGKDMIVSGLKPGLYEINLMRSNGSGYEPTASSWILVTTPADHEKTSAAFQEMRRTTDEWGTSVRPETKRLVLRAALENLTEGPEK
ncbi:MAG: hypothetical protein AB7F88_04930 [Pyrinomonadaceae bacterium]